MQIHGGFFLVWVRFEVCPYSARVYKGYAKIPEQGSIPGAYGFDLGLTAQPFYQPRSPGGLVTAVD